MFSVVIPIFNESENIKSLFEEIKESLKKYKDFELIYVNDCSTDDSDVPLTKIKNNNINIQVLFNKKNQGQSYSINKGIQSAIYNTIVTIDGDGQNNPKDLEKIIDLFFLKKEFGLIGGIRVNRKDNLIKIFSSKLANLVRSFILNDDCKDTGCSLKIFDKNGFNKFPYFDGMHRFLPALFKGYGYKTFFVEVDHRHRKFGISKYGTFDRLFKGIFDMIKVKQILKNAK